MFLNEWDYFILHFLNQWAHQFEVFDRLTARIADSQMLKGVFVMTCFWWTWFASTKNQKKQHSTLLATLLAACSSLFIARVLALTLPFRLRPLHNPEFNLTLPYGISLEASSGWSAFPSDHAALYGTLAVGILCCSRKIGSIVLTYTLLFILFPRVYLGLHHPSDIVGGLLVGCFTLYLMLKPSLQTIFIQPLLHWSDKHPASFYAAFFLGSYQLIKHFATLRSVGKFFFTKLGFFI